MPKKGSTAVKVTFMTMTLVTPVTAVKFDYGAVVCSEDRQYICLLKSGDFGIFRKIENFEWENSKVSSLKSLNKIIGT